MSTFPILTHVDAKRVLPPKPQEADSNKETAQLTKPEEKDKEIVLTATAAADGKKIKDIEDILNKRFDGYDMFENSNYLLKLMSRDS